MERGRSPAQERRRAPILRTLKLHMFGTEQQAVAQLDNTVFSVREIGR